MSNNNNNAGDGSVHSPRSIQREILSIGIPSVIETLFITMSAIINSKMVSSLGISAISAVSVTNQPRLFVFSVFFAIYTAESSLTARYIGRKDRDNANRVLLMSLAWVLVLGIILGILCVIFAEPIMKICSNQPDTMESSVLYFRIVMGGMLFNLLFMAVNASLRGIGKTKLTLITNVVSCLVNIIFDYFLIEGHFGFPALGIKGAAIATVLGTAAALFPSFGFVMKRDSYISLNYCITNKIKVTAACFKEMWDMWKKVASEFILTRIGILFSGIIAARSGSFDMSVYSIGMHLLNINYAIGSGFQSSAIALAGRSYGSKKPDDLKMYSNETVRIGLIVSIISSAIFILFSKPYFGFFSPDTKFVFYGVISSWIIGVIAPIQTLQIIYNGILQGIGDVKFTLFAAVVSVTIINTMICYIGTILLGCGIWGIWAAVFVSQTARMFMLRNRYRKNKRIGDLYE